MGRSKNIWLNPSLEKVIAGIEKKNGRAGQFSRRLGNIAERYEMLLDSMDAPELSATEFAILGDALCSSELNSLSIKYMHENILHSAIGTEQERKNLSERAEKWSVAEKITLLEKSLHI